MSLPPSRLPLGSWGGIRWIRLRAAVLGACLLLGLALVVGRAVHLQVLEKDWLGGLAQDQYARTLELSPHRGEIVDRLGVTLASSVDVDSIFVDPLLLGREPEERRAAFREVARAAGLSREEAEKLLPRLEAQGARFLWVRRMASPTVAARVRELGLAGVGFVKESKRFYPQRELASQVLGFVGADGHGLEGLERHLDGELRGKGATVAALRDARGRALYSEASVPSEDRTGATVRLTLDRTIQYHAEKALAEGRKKNEARSASAVVMDVQSGEVLAMATVPSFNPNVGPGPRSAEAARNRPLTDPFEPGSTMKVFLLAGALERGKVRKNQTFDCENGVWQVGRNRIHDSKRYGLLTPPQMLRVSSNIGTGKVAQLLGAEGMESIYRSFGFGRRTGVDLPAEAGGLVGPFRGDIGLITGSFGQGAVMATPLQLAAGFASIANGGVLRKPWIVHSVAGPDGTVIRRGQPEEVGRVIREETAREILSWMEGVVEEGGTGTLASMAGYSVAGKTGTTQKVDPGTGRYGRERIASFAGVVPADRPRLAIVVVLDEPQKEKYGGRAAAPIFREIAEAALATLGIPPARGREGLAALPIAPSDDVSEGYVALAEGSEAEEKVRVPDLRGLAARAAVRGLGGLGLEAAIEGSGRVASQVPAPGSVVERGSRVALVLESP